MVQEGWLAPLLAPLMRDANVVTVPLLTDPSSEGLRNGGFDWRLDPLEDVAAASDLGRSLVGQGLDQDQPLALMAGRCFAVHTSFWFKLDGYLGLSLGVGQGTWPARGSPQGSGAPHVELSLRVWSCGGAIYRVPCSVVWHQPRTGMHTASATEIAAAQRSALLVAELWFSADAPKVWAA